jgi:transposase InsO family protein
VEASLWHWKRPKRKSRHWEKLKRTPPGYRGAQDTYYVGTIKGVGRIYQQTFIDTCTKGAFAKVYDRKNALVAADMLNDKVLPFFEEHQIALLRILTDRRTEFCGAREQHAYELCLALEDIDHSRTKAKHPQTNGICERFHRTIQEGFYCVAFRKKIYESLEQLQIDLDHWVSSHNQDRTHTGKCCYGRTPRQTLRDNKHLAQEKMLRELPPAA